MKEKVYEDGFKKACCDLRDVIRDDAEEKLKVLEEEDEEVSLV